ncbi:MAG: T9SS type A sorting domain-containing protein, partial [Flavobacteriales bacterium]|nr:T9SS type A sorting domain-containing protein [Flavobacteriales bacterium]
VPLPDVIITEIMKDPASVEDGFGEYFEIYNLEDTIVDINGWVLSDDGSNSHTINNGGPLTIGSGEFLVLGINSDGLTNGGLTVDYQYSSYTLSNGDDEVILSVGANEVDRVAYDDITFPDSTGASLNLDPGSFDAIANDNGANWCFSTSTYGDGDQGTPGSANDACGLDCSVFDTAPVDLTKSFDPVNGVQDRVQVKWFKASPQVRYSDEDAAACDIKFWPKRNLNPDGTVTGPVIVAAPEDTILISNTKKFQPDGVTPREIFKWPVKFRADGANNNKRAEPNIRYEWQVRCACDHGAGPESPWSVVKIFNTPDFDPSTGIFTPPGDVIDQDGNMKSLQPELRIYPNPSTGDRVRITLNDLVDTDQKIVIEVIDFTGKMIFSEQVSNKGRNASIQVDFDRNLSRGMYFMNLYVNDKIMTEKFIVE